MDTRIEICCAGKPGLLLSTVTTLEALGLEIQQCVISCFNDFAMQASCSEVCIKLYIGSSNLYYSSDTLRTSICLCLVGHALIVSCLIVVH